MTREEWTRDLILTGYVDERGAYTISNIKSAPNGEFGMAMLCVKGEELSIYDTDFSAKPGRLMYTIRLPEITDVRLSTFALHPTLKFTYQNFRWSFMAGFGKKLPISELFASLAGAKTR